MAYKRIDTVNLFKNSKGNWSQMAAFYHDKNIDVRLSNDDEQSMLLGPIIFTIDKLGRVEFTKYNLFTAEQLQDIADLSKSLKENTND